MTRCVQAAAEFALAVHAHGFPGVWTAHFDTPIRARWGPWVLPVSKTLVVSTDGTVASLMAAGDDDVTMNLDRVEGRWIADSGQALTQAQVGDRSVLVLSAEGLTDDAFDDVRPRIAKDVSSSDAALALERAGKLFEDSVPHYGAWVSAVVRSVIPLATTGDMLLSGSYVGRPGIITCSLPAPTYMLSELLVHEATHQYFYMLTRLGEVDDGSDLNLYYSPARREERPLRFILLAYHAFANIMLFQREVLAADVDGASLRYERQGELRSWLHQLEAPLSKTRALTPLGRALWEPLAERL